jgi:TfoX/Sxy family transcriptional regulator of competence genes
MAYDEDLAERVRAALGSVKGVTEIKMFGGLCFTVGGNMAVGVSGDDLMVRLPPEEGEGALAERGARPIDFTGRPMRGFVYVGPEGLGSEPALRRWVDRGAAFAASLPPKTAKPKKGKPTKSRATGR